MRKHHLPPLLLSLSLFLSLVAACTRPNDRSGPAATATPPTVTTPRPTPPPAGGTTVLADGHLVAPDPALTLGFTTGGQVLSLVVAAGDRVSAGDEIARLDDAALREAIDKAELAVASAENNVAQADLSLRELLAWAPDETAVALAEANLAAAEASLARAETQDAVAGNNLTSSRVNLTQAERALADAQDNYDTAHDSARDWELNDPFRSERLKAEREATERGLQSAREGLEVARAQYNLALAGLNDDTALNAAASVLSAQQSLETARRGPSEEEIAAAELRREAAQITLDQNRLSLESARAALEDAILVAPWDGTILSVEIAPGAQVGAGTPIVTLQDTGRLQFHTSNLSERDLRPIQPRLPAEIVLKTYPEQTIPGTVARVAPIAGGALGDAAVFTVIVDLGPTDLDLRPGMTGRVEIAGGE